MSLQAERARLLVAGRLGDDKLREMYAELRELRLYHPGTDDHAETSKAISRLTHLQEQRRARLDQIDAELRKR